MYVAVYKIDNIGIYLLSELRYATVIFGNPSIVYSKQAHCTLSSESVVIFSRTRKSKHSRTIAYKLLEFEDVIHHIIVHIDWLTYKKLYR